MPYIKPAKRGSLDEKIDPLIDVLRQAYYNDAEDLDGCLNYTLTRLFHALYPTKYFHLNRAIGVVECVKLELYRRVMSPYEDKKIIENGDVQ